MSLSFIPVTSQSDITRLAELASFIWHEFWTERLGIEQVDYMVGLFQSEEAITCQIADEDYEYWFICESADGGNADRKRSEGGNETVNDKSSCRIIGYTGGRVESETNRFFISKIYLLKEKRGKGLSQDAIRFYDELCQTRGLRAMYLTVNKYNEGAIRAYQRSGFETISANVFDIGEGYVMDDYVMEKVTSSINRG